MSKLVVKNADRSPDEVRTPPKTKVQVVDLNGVNVMKASFEPGWKWSECVKPTARTSSCQVEHIIYVISGRLVIKMDDGTEKELAAGDFGHVPGGHDAWVPGNEPCIAVDFLGARNFARK